MAMTFPRALAGLAAATIAAATTAQIPCFETNRGTNLNLPIFGVAGGLTLPFTFPGPTGPTSTISVAANGFVDLLGSINPGIPVSATAFPSTARIAALWDLLDPTVGAGVFFNTLPAGGGLPARAVVTWDCLEAAGFGVVLVQLQLLADGRIVIHHAGSTFVDSDAVVGIAGSSSATPVDFSTASFANFNSGVNPTIYDSMLFTTSVGPTYDLSGMTLLFTPNGLGGYQVSELLGCRTGDFETYGRGCSQPSSFYQYFQARTPVDLSGKAYRFLPNGSGGWIGFPGTPAFAPFANSLGLQAFGMAPVSLPFPFVHPGGVSTSIDVCADGLVWLDGGNPNNFSFCCDGDILLFLGGDAVIAPLWTGLDPGAGGGVFSDFDVTSGAQVITWNNCPAVNGIGQASVQLLLFPTGEFEVRYGGVTIGDENIIVGYNKSAGSIDGGNRDLDEMPWNSGAAGVPVRLQAAPGSKPHVGSPFTIDISSIGSLPAVGAFILSNAPSNVDLTGAGAPGCLANVDIFSPGASQIELFFTSADPYSPTFPIPNNSALIGANAFVQAAVLQAGANAFGIAVSNGGFARIGL